MNIFLTYIIPDKDQQKAAIEKVEKFKNKDQNFEICWYPSLKSYYNEYLHSRLELLKTKNEREAKKQALGNPIFLLAHELYDALPVHSFQLNEKREWCEKVVQINS